MYTRLTGLLLLISLLLLSGLPLAAQEVALLQKAEVMIVRPGEAAPAFACAEEDCERLAWLPAGARVWIIGQVEGRELEGSPQWYDVLLDCPCFDYEHRFLENAPVMSVSATGSWTLWEPRWSPDGARITAAVDTDLYVWDAATGTLLTQEPLAPFNLLPPAWSPDGTRMALMGLDHKRQISLLLLVDNDGQPLASPLGQFDWIAGAAWSPDGTRLAVGSDVVHILDAQSGNTLLTIDTSASSIAWSPDGMRLVTGNLLGDVAQVWDAGEGQLLHTLDGETGVQVLSMTWSPDGARIAAFDFFQSTIRVWDASDGRLVGELAESVADYIFNATWSPDGTQILYALTGDLRGRLKRWGGMEQERPRMLVDTRQGILNFSLSPAGRFLVVGIEGAVRILDAATGRTLADLARPGEQEHFNDLVQWSPDGRRIAAAGTQYSRRVAVGTRQSSAELWDLTLIPDGHTRAFIHSSHLIPDAAADS